MWVLIEPYADRSFLSGTAQIAETRTVDLASINPARPLGGGQRQLLQRLDPQRLQTSGLALP